MLAKERLRVTQVRRPAARPAYDAPLVQKYRHAVSFREREGQCKQLLQQGAVHLNALPASPRAARGRVVMIVRVTTANAPRIANVQLAIHVLSGYKPVKGVDQPVREAGDVRRHRLQTVSMVEGCRANDDGREGIHLCTGKRGLASVGK